MSDDCKDSDLLTILVKGILTDLGAAREASLTRFVRYRAAGEKLIAARKLCPSRRWEDWLNDNFNLSRRHARRLMRFAKTDVTSDLPALRSRWNSICGNIPSRPGRVEPRGGEEDVLGGEIPSRVAGAPQRPSAVPRSAPARSAPAVVKHPGALEVYPTRPVTPVDPSPDVESWRSPEPPPSQQRVELVFNPSEYGKFKFYVSHLQYASGIDNPSDVVLESLRRWYEEDMA